MSWWSTRPWPFPVTTREPTGGSSLWNSSYTSCSNRRQHFSRPHRPEIFVGSSVDLCSLAIFIDTGGITAESAQSYLDLPNVLSVGGSWIAPTDLIARREWNAIEARARDAATCFKRKPAR